MNVNFNFDLKKIMSDKEQVEKIALFALIGAAVIAGFWLILFSPGFSSISKLKKKCVEMSSEIEDAGEKIKNAQKIRDRYASCEARIGELQSQMPMLSDPSWIVSTVGEIEKKLKVKTEKIVPYSEKAPPGTQETEENPLFTHRYAQININAGYHQIGQFINELEGKIKYLQILNISIEGDANAPYKHHAEIKIKYPVLKQPLIE